MEELIRDIPRLYTGIAEWAACMIIILLMKKRIHGIRLVTISAVMLIIQTAFMVFTEPLKSDFLWILCMSGAIALMFTFIFVCCDMKILDVIFCCAYSFIIAEFMASLEWQLYCFFWEKSDAPIIIQIVGIVLIYSLVSYIIYRLIHNHMPENVNLNLEIREVVAEVSIVIVIFILSNLSFVTNNTPFSGLSNSEIMNIRTFIDFGGVAMLHAYFVQRNELHMRSELEAMQNIFTNQYQQYQQSKENIDIINRKYHDLKHQIAALRAETDQDRRNAFLDEIEQDIKNYEAQNKTGNHVLDTILTSKSLYCAQKNIELTSVVDGKILDFMYTMDLCSIFGNALDNAIECEQRIKDYSKRLIHLTVSAQKGFALIRVENYCEEKVRFEDHLPLTNKADKTLHGYGMKSMSHVAQKYGGTLMADQSNNWFELKILIPLPQSKEK